MLLLLARVAAGQYAGSEACRSCHPAQFTEQSKTGHARALARPARHALSGAFPKNAGEWAFGAGEQAVTFVSRLDEDHYIEHGLSYYTRSGATGLTPGHRSSEGVRYRIFDPGAAILRCFQCHSTGPLRLGDSSEIVPFELGVRCESCHGPGREHIDLKGSTFAIRNPRRFTAEALNDFCGSCHRKQSSGSETNWNDAWNVRHQPLYLAQSRCFTQSSGKLSCFTCHAPHSPVSRSLIDYDLKCRSCHEAVRHKTPVARQSCAACHMPSVKLDVNLTFANHWIGVFGRDNALRPIFRR